MILLWITLLLLHQGYALISVNTVQLGDPVTFTCLFPGWEYSNARVKWYKQSVGDTLKLITVLMKSTTKPIFEEGFPASRFEANLTTTMSTLTISKTIQEDEAVYHCAGTTWSKDQWSGTYLSLIGNTQKTSNYYVVQRPTVSDSVRPGDLMTLQCSVLSDSENETCPGDHSVYWFKTGSDKSHPNIIYTGGNRHDECDKRSDTQKSCIYHFSKSVSSSDAGTYYCAVATCGEILFGNGTKVEIEVTDWRLKNVILFPLCAVLAISLIVIAFLICGINKNNCDYCNNEDAVSLQENIAKRNLERNEETRIYSVVVFNKIKNGSSENKDSRERIYAAIKAFGLD